MWKCCPNVSGLVRGEAQLRPDQHQQHLQSSSSCFHACKLTAASPALNLFFNKQIDKQTRTLAMVLPVKSSLWESIDRLWSISSDLELGILWFQMTSIIWKVMELISSNSSVQSQGWQTPKSMSTAAPLCLPDHQNEWQAPQVDWNCLTYVEKKKCTYIFDINQIVYS